MDSSPASKIHWFCNPGQVIFPTGTLDNMNAVNFRVFSCSFQFPQWKLPTTKKVQVQTYLKIIFNLEDCSLPISKYLLSTI